MSAKQNLYKVTNGDVTRLVQAESEEQALRYVADDSFTAEIVSATDLPYLLSDGIPVETATQN